MGRPRKPTKTEKTLFDLVISQDEQKEEIKDTIQFYISTHNMQQDTHNSNLFLTVPAGSILDTITKKFKEGTDIPLEIPLFSVLHFLSAYLISNEIHINFHGKKMECDIWSVMLASSGAGKTFTFSIVEEEAEAKNLVGQLPSSAAAYIPSLNKGNNRKLIVRDEFAQLLKSMKTQGYMEEMKDYLLRTYDNSPLERVTKKDVDRIEKPVISFLGMTALESFNSNVSLEDMLDGFAQRFSYIIAKKDPSRPMKDYPLYHVDFLKKGLKEEFEAIFNSIKHKEYIYSEDGLQEFYSSFATFATKYEDIPESFFRRIAFRVVKYALIYHVILKKESNIIDKEDFSWASRIMSLLLINSREMINSKDKNEFFNIYQKCKKIYIEKVKERGYCRASDLVQYCNDISKASEAKAIMTILETDPDVKKEEEVKK